MGTIPMRRLRACVYEGMCEGMYEGTCEGMYEGTCEGVHATCYEANRWATIILIARLGSEHDDGSSETRKLGNSEARKLGSSETSYDGPKYRRRPVGEDHKYPRNIDHPYHSIDFCTSLYGIGPVSTEGRKARQLASVPVYPFTHLLIYSQKKFLYARARGSSSMVSSYICIFFKMSK